jgi:hypothetical protein
MIKNWNSFIAIVIASIGFINTSSSVVIQDILKLEENNNFDNPFKRPNEIYHDMETACNITHEMIKNQTIAMVNTNLNNFDSHNSMAMSFPEYAIDCYDSGNPVLLLIQMSRNWKNIANYSGYHSSITYTADLNKQWPGAVPGSMYGSPRVNLHGHFREIKIINDENEHFDESNINSDQLKDVRYVTKEEILKLEQCFKKEHPESSAWFPGSSNTVHNSAWTEFLVDDGYFVGGFGGYAYIGNVKCW